MSSDNLLAETRSAAQALAEAEERATELEQKLGGKSEAAAVPVGVLPHAAHR
ncbi:hypothetical protein PYCC9005_004231 [Savitreella phatthalungensis]